MRLFSRDELMILYGLVDFHAGDSAVGEVAGTIGQKILEAIKRIDDGKKGPLNLYFIRARSGDDNFDLFVRAPTEMEAYDLWLQFWWDGNPVDYDYDLYLIPEAVDGVIPWATGTKAELGEVALISASYREPAADTPSAAEPECRLG